MFIQFSIRLRSEYKLEHEYKLEQRTNLNFWTGTTVVCRHKTRRDRKKTITRSRHIICHVYKCYCLRPYREFFHEIQLRSAAWFVVVGKSRTDDRLRVKRAALQGCHMQNILFNSRISYLFIKKIIEPLGIHHFPLCALKIILFQKTRKGKKEILQT